MLPSSYQTLLIILPLIISSTHSLPDNIFNKREAFGGPITGAPQATGGLQATGGPQATGGSPHGHFGGGCTDGWQACMSSLCAGGGQGANSNAGPAATGVATDSSPEATGAPVSDGSATDAATDAATSSVGSGSKRRRQAPTGGATDAPNATQGPATGAPVTGGPGPAETGGGSPHGHNKQHKGFGGIADFCSGFSDFMQQSGGPLTGGAITGGAATGPPAGATAVDTATTPQQS